MIICAAIKDTRTGAVFGGIRHGFIYSAMHGLNCQIKWMNVIRLIMVYLQKKCTLL